MSSTRYDPMESWGKVRVDALELQDPYHRTDPEPLTEARQIAKMKALMTINRKITTGGSSDANSAFLLFKEVERILNEAEICDNAQQYLVAKELYRTAVPMLFKCGERSQSERCKSLVVLADAREALRLAGLALREQRFKDAIKHADDAEQITQLPTATMREWRPIIRNQGCSVRKTCGFYLLDESERLRCAGDASESLASAAKAVALLNTVDDDTAYRQAHLQWCRAMRFTAHSAAIMTSERPEDVSTMLLQVKSICSDIEDPFGAALCSHSRVYSLVSDGCLAEAAASCPAACLTFERMRDDQGVGTVQEAQSWCFLWRGRAEEALGAAAAALRAYRVVNDEHSLLRCQCLEAFVRAMMGQIDEPQRLARQVVKRDVGVGVHVMVVCCALAVDAFVSHIHASAKDSADAAAATDAAAAATAAAAAAAAALERWSSSGCAPCDGWMAWAFVWLLTEVVTERFLLLPPPAALQFEDLLSAFSSYRRSAGTAVVVAAARLQLAVARQKVSEERDVDLCVRSAQACAKLLHQGHCQFPYLCAKALLQASLALLLPLKGRVSEQQDETLARRGRARTMLEQALLLLFPKDVMHGRHTVQFKAEVVCCSSMQLLPLCVKAAHFTVVAAAACAPSMANPSMVHDRVSFAAAVRGLGECVEQLHALSPYHAAICQWWHALALTRAGLREPLLYAAVKAPLRLPTVDIKLRCSGCSGLLQSISYACTLCIGAAFCPGCYSSSEKMTCHVPPLLLRCPLALDEMVKQAELRQQWQEQDTISNSTTITPMIRRIRPDAAAASKTYPVLLRVRTSAVRGAGTSAAVFVSLYGTTGTALNQPLLHPRMQGGARKFSEGSDDVFLVQSPQLLGKVQRVRVWHDNTGQHPDWHLKSIEVSEFSDPLADVLVFVFNQWLSMDKDNCSIQCEVDEPYVRKAASSFQRNTNPAPQPEDSAPQPELGHNSAVMPGVSPSRRREQQNTSPMQRLHTPGQLGNNGRVGTPKH